MVDLIDSDSRGTLTVPLELPSLRKMPALWNIGF